MLRLLKFIMKGSIMFKKATKERSKLRIAITGPSGSGKSYTSLQLAATLSDKIAAIDTERGSLSKYADIVPFDVMELDTFHPDNYVKAIEAAVDGGYEVLIIDSISHEWEGEGGVLQLVDQKAAVSKSGNAYTAWRYVTPLHNKFIDTIIRAPIHIIVTMRSKTTYVMEDTKSGKKAPKKVGLQPIQRDNVEYEFDIVADMTITNMLEISKSRFADISGQIVDKPAMGCDLFVSIANWLKSNPATTQSEAVKAVPAKVQEDKPRPKGNTLDKKQAMELAETASTYGINGSELKELLTELGYDGLLSIPVDQHEHVLAEIINRGDINEANS